MDPYLAAVEQLAEKTSPPAWNLDRFDLATMLLRMLCNPDLLNQFEFGFCGEIPFLRAWLYRDPNAVIKFVSELYETGTASIGAYVVRAADRLRQNDYIARTPGQAIGSAAWMVCSALADTESDIAPDCNGDPPGTSGALTWELKNWLDATRLYSSIDADLCAFNETTGTILTSILTGIPGINLSDSQTIDDLIRQLSSHAPIGGGDYGKADVFLAINTNMFRNLLSSSPSDLAADWHGGVFSWIANHWIMLDGPVEDLGNGQVRLRIWTWGQRYTIVLTKKAFDSDYYGSIRAYAYADRRTIVPMPPQGAIGTVDAWYSQQGTLELDWWSYVENVAYFCAYDAVTGENLPGYLWNKDKLNIRWSMPIPDPVDPHAHAYAIQACNYWSEDPISLTSACTDGRWAWAWPDCRTETQNFRFFYFGYKSPNQIRDGMSLRGVEVRSSAGRHLGRSYSDGRMEIILDNRTVAINLESNTPDFVATLAIALEYCQRSLVRYGLRPDHNDKIEVRIGRPAAAASVDPHTGHGKLTFDPTMSYETIPLAALDALLDLCEVRSGLSKGLGLWRAPIRTVMHDTLLGLDQFHPLVASFAQHPDKGFGAGGAEAFAAYLGLDVGDPRGVIREMWNETAPARAQAAYFEFVYSDKQKDVYNDDTMFGDFVLAMANRLLPRPSTDARFNFGAYSGVLARPKASSDKLVSQLALQGSLLGNGAVMFHSVGLDPGVSNVAVSFKADRSEACPLLQIVLLDGNGALLDVIKTDKCKYDRTIGLRGGAVKSLLFVVANRIGTGFGYALQTSNVQRASDVMITRWSRPSGRELISADGLDWDCADIWLTSDDPTIPRDTVDVLNNSDWSVVHVRLHNFGNQDARQVRLRVYFQKGNVNPSDERWQPMQFDNSPDGLVLDVPANGSSEVTGRWFCPIRSSKSLTVETISLAAELDGRDDLSPDNNRATKNHVSTNCKIVTIPDLPHIHLVWPEVHWKDERPWSVGVHLDGENILAHAGPLSRSVKLSRAITKETPDGAAASLDIEVDAARLLGMRKSPPASWSKSRRFPAAWTKASHANTDLVPITVTMAVDGHRRQGFTTMVPVNTGAKARDTETRAVADG